MKLGSLRHKTIRVDDKDKHPSTDKSVLSGQGVCIDRRRMFRLRSAVVMAFVTAQVSTFTALPSQAHNHEHHHGDHFVSAIGYHYAGHGRCVRNGPWWTGRRPVEWGPYYEPRNKSGSVSFEGPNGGEIKLRW